MGSTRQSPIQDNWDLRTRLSAICDNLRPAEQRVARFLLDHGHQYPDFTLADLAQKAGSSQSAVVEMCQSIGLSGFREFRLMWVKELATRPASDLFDSQLFGGLFSELLHTERLLQEGLETAATSIASAKQVFLFGSGGSGLVAGLCAEGLAVAGRMAYTFNSDERITSSFFSDQTVIVVISHRGENPVLAQAMEQARQVGATSILITSRPESPLASLADQLLITAAPSGHAMPLINSKVRALQLAVVHALVEAVGRQINKDVDVQTFARWQHNEGLS